MAEKHTPPIRPVGKPDGIAKGTSHSTITGQSYDHANGSIIYSEGTNSEKILSKK